MKWFLYVSNAIIPDVWTKMFISVENRVFYEKYVYPNIIYFYRASTPSHIIGNYINEKKNKDRIHFEVISLVVR